MLSGAERQRRYRLHRAGDHSLCDPERGCDRSAEIDTEPAAEVPQAARRAKAPSTRNRAPDGYEHERGPRGRKLWDDLAPLLDGQPAVLLLLEELCRMADRLDRLDYVLADRRSWLETETDDGGRVIVVVDAALGEARQHASALRALVADIAKALPKPSTSKPVEGGGVIADLTAAIAARRGAAAG